MLNRRPRAAAPGAVLCAALILAAGAVSAAVLSVDLYASADFAVLAGAGITITGPTTITGDIGSHPTLSITGLENLTLNGVNHGGGARRTTCRSGRSTCPTIRCCRSRSSWRDIKPRCSATGARRPGSTSSTSTSTASSSARPQRDLRHRAGPRRPGAGGQRLSGRHLQRGLSRHHAGRGRGCSKLFKQFSFPGGIPSHVAPETPGSIHEGGELGYSLSHAFGAAFDNPDLVVACVVGDGEAETGPLATSWHSNKFLNPVHDGAVLPILHLNGYKIANPHRAGAHPATRAGR
jgi:hypothetical protein